MKELSMKYGKNKPFEDDKIITEITAMTYPSVGEFLKTHVQGDVPINYDEFFEMVGLTKGQTEVETNYIFAGGQNVIFDGDQQAGTIFFSDMALKNSFWASQDVKSGDIIKKVNGQELTLQNVQQVIGGMFMWQEGQEITMDLERDGEPILIKATLTKPMAIDESIIENTEATNDQIELRKAWLKG
jgi:C-terminal processing protease CtpA/Prc